MNADLVHACTVIAEEGCYSDSGIPDRDRVDREGRIAVAAKDLESWVRESPEVLTGIIKEDQVVVVARMIARAMLAQYEYTVRDNADTDAAMCAEALVEIGAVERSIAALKDLLGPSESDA
jgi:hypothetical protein